MAPSEDRKSNEEEVEINRSCVYDFEQYLEIENKSPEDCPSWYDDNCFFLNRDESNQYTITPDSDDPKFALPRGEYKWLVTDSKPHNWIVVDD